MWQHPESTSINCWYSFTTGCRASARRKRGMPSSSWAGGGSRYSTFPRPDESTRSSRRSAPRRRHGIVTLSRGALARSGSRESDHESLKRGARHGTRGKPSDGNRGGRADHREAYGPPAVDATGDGQAVKVLHVENLVRLSNP